MCECVGETRRAWGGQTEEVCVCSYLCSSRAAQTAALTVPRRWGRCTWEETSRSRVTSRFWCLFIAGSISGDLRLTRRREVKSGPLCHETECSDGCSQSAGLIPLDRVANPCNHVELQHLIWLLYSSISAEPATGSHQYRLVREDPVAPPAVHQQQCLL